MSNRTGPAPSYAEVAGVSDYDPWLVYPRDASWYRRPDQRTTKKMHRESAEYRETPACNPNGALLVMEMSMDAEELLRDGRDYWLCGRCFGALFTLMAS